MSQEISRSGQRRDEELTTAHLAGAGERTTLQDDRGSPAHQSRPRTIEVGPSSEPAASNIPRNASIAGEHVSSDKTAKDERSTPLFSAEEANELRVRWNSIQATFVDEPRRAVEQADSLVAQTMKRLAEVFATERSGLESQWARGDNVSTEDLRIAFRRYRSFFGRLLSV